MAQACACDRCGKFFVVKSDMRRSDDRRYIVCDREARYLNGNMDLCDSCYEELERFFESRKSQTI